MGEDSLRRVEQVMLYCLLGFAVVSVIWASVHFSRKYGCARRGRPGKRAPVRVVASGADDTSRLE